MSSISKPQFDFYTQNRSKLIDQYLNDFPLRIDPDAVRDLFMPIGYNRSNVKAYDEICKVLTEDIFFEALNRNLIVRKIIFASGLPGSGKSTHLTKMTKDELVYDGTINDDEKFVRYINRALMMGYKVQVFIYSVQPEIAFQRNLNRGDELGRYVPVGHYEKVADSLNRREALLIHNFQKRVKLFNFEHTRFEGKLNKFSNIKIDRDGLETIARNHRFSDSEILHSVIE